MPKACNVRSNFSSTSALRKKGRSNLLALTPNTPYPPSSMWLEAACSSISAVSVYPHLSSSSSPPGIITLEFQLVSVTQSHVKSRLTSTIGVAAVFGQFHLLIRHLLLVVFRKQHVFDKFFASLISFGNSWSSRFSRRRRSALQRGSSGSTILTPYTQTSSEVYM